MSARWTGWIAAALVMLLTAALIVDEITNAKQRSWWGSHSLTTDTVSGLLVLLITILVVNQLINVRQSRQRSHAIAAQTAIVAGQAAQSTKAVSALVGGSGDRHTATDSYRTYMVMLLICAPVFIDDPAALHFLEQAQNLGGKMTGVFMDRSTDGAAVSGDGLDAAMQKLQSAAAPLLEPLSPNVRDSIQRLGGSAEK